MDPITEPALGRQGCAEPIPHEQNDNNNEQEEQIEQQPQIKKKELSQKQIDHLNNIRVKALEKKREIKLNKNEEYKKQAMKKKVNPVQQIEPAAGRQGYAELKQEEIKQEVKPDEAKPKKKVIKQVIKYVEADEDDEDEEEEIIITKSKRKEKQNIKPHAVPEPSYNDLLYQISLERLQTKMMSERAKNIVYSVMPNYY